MRASGLVLNPRRYLTSVQPPASLEDTSRFKNDGTFTAITQVRLPSGLWVQNYNGVSSTISIPHHASINPTTITMLIWAYLNNLAGEQGLIEKSFERQFYKDAVTHRPVFKAQFGTTVLVAGRWYFIAGTHNGTNATIFVNGVQEGTSAQAFVQNTAAVTIGSYEASANWWNGMLALPRMYNYPMTASDIYKLFQSERRLFGV